jgi:hypothetical protein
MGGIEQRGGQSDTAHARSRSRISRLAAAEAQSQTVSRILH